MLAYFDVCISGQIQCRVDTDAFVSVQLVCIESSLAALNAAGMDFVGFGMNYEDSRKNYVVEKDGQKYLFIDTAGIRRSAKVEDRIEKFSVLRAKMAVERKSLTVPSSTTTVTDVISFCTGLPVVASKI